MARYQIILAYDGTPFAGYQKQANARTVQADLERALRTIGWNGDKLLCAGRTDSGVHATGQVVAVDFDWKQTDHQLLQAINANLPQEIAVRAINQTHPDFHPRFDAISRQYRYQILIDPVPHPLRERFFWRIREGLNIQWLKRSSAAILGKHDFAAYGTPPRAGSSTIREIQHSEWTQTEFGYEYVIQANAFLYHMVRRLVYVQVLFGAGKASLDEYVTNMERGLLEFPGIAPAKGLILEKVLYGENDRLLRRNRKSIGEDDRG